MPSRRKWPLDRYCRPKLSAILLQIVPFPDPGGPKTAARKNLAISSYNVRRVRFAPDLGLHQICRKFLFSCTWTTKATLWNSISARQEDRVDLYALPYICVQRNCSPQAQEWSQNDCFFPPSLAPVDVGSSPASLRTEIVLREWMRESPQRPILLRASSRKNAEGFTGGGTWLL